MVVELDEEALQQLAGGFARERAVGQAALEERQQVLVQVAGVEGVPAIELGDDRQVAKPVVLERLMEIPRRLRGHMTAHLGDLEQLGAPLRPGFLGGQFPGQGRVAFREQNDARRTRYRTT